jgi:hypothetical protein
MRDKPLYLYTKVNGADYVLDHCGNWSHVLTRGIPFWRSHDAAVFLEAHYSKPRRNKKDSAYRNSYVSDSGVS